MNKQIICTKISGIDDKSCDISKYKLTYPLSYEDYSDNPLEENPDLAFNKQLRSFKGIENYCGVCGGGSQNLYILSKLLEKNDISDIRLIDINPRQLNNFKDLSNICNKSRSDAEYKSALKDHCIKYCDDAEAGWDIYSSCKQNIERPIFSTDVNVKLIFDSIEQQLIKNDIKGKSFIYLSNIPNAKEVLDIIKTEDKFEEGTIVLLVDSLSISYNIGEKIGNDINVIFQG